MVIDCHCHAGKGDGLRGPWDTSAPLDRYLRRAARAGIDRTVLFPVLGSTYDEANRQVAQVVASNRDRFYGFVFVHSERDRGRIDRIVSNAVESYGFRGIKAHRANARISREICETARRYSVPVLYDVMGDWSVAELLAHEYPDVDFIIPHLGSFSDDWSAQLAIIDQISRHPNIHADTSGVRRFDLLEEAVKRAGPDKLLFGTDGPWLHPGVELFKVRALGLPEGAERMILGENFLRLIARRTRSEGRSSGQGSRLVARRI
jgi:uncharacterized protein